MLQCRPHAPPARHAEASRSRPAQQRQAGQPGPRQRSPSSRCAACGREAEARGEEVGRLAAGTLLSVGLLALCAWPAVAAPEAPLAPAADLEAHPLRHALGLLASEEDFWSNVGRYISYFFSVLLGTAYTAAKPIGSALKRPGTAAAVLTALALLLAFLTFTVKAMLGLQDVGLQNAGGIS